MASQAELLILLKARDEASRTLRGVQGAAQKMGAVMKLAAGAGVVALAGLGIASVKMAADFEAALSESLAIMGDVSDKLRGEMSDAAREVALTTTFSAKEAAEAYFFLASAGLSAAQSIEALPKVAAFAQAGAFDMATATDLLTDAQSALGLVVDDTAKNMENMTHVSDVLVGANTLANASVQQFSEALTNKAGAAMRALNMDTEAGVAVLTVFADQGIKGSEAGTQFAIVLRDLQTKALKNADAFAAQNVAVFDAQGNMNNMADIIGDLEGALAGMSDAQAKATLLQLGFSDKSIAALQALLGQSEAIRDNEAALRSMGGVTDEVAKKQLQNFSAQLSLLKSQFEDMMITVGNKVLPVLTRFATWLRTEGIPKAKELARELQAKLSPAVNFLRDAFDLLRPKVEATGRVIGKIIGFLNENREILAAVAIAIAIVLIPAFVAWAVAAGAAAIATIAATLPILLIIAAIALLVLGIILLVKHWDEVTAFLKAAWAATMAFLLSSVGQLRDFFVGNFNRIKNLVINAWNATVSFVVEKAIWVKDQVVAKWGTMKTKVMEIVTGIKDGIVGKFNEVVGFISGLGGRLFGAGQRVFEALGRGVKLGINTVIGFVESGINTVLSGIAAYLATINSLLNKIPGFLGGQPAWGDARDGHRRPARRDQHPPPRSRRHRDAPHAGAHRRRGAGGGHTATWPRRGRCRRRHGERQHLRPLHGGRLHRPQTGTGDQARAGRAG